MTWTKCGPIFKFFHWQTPKKIVCVSTIQISISQLLCNTTLRNLTSSSAVADEPARRATMANVKIFKQLRDHNHAPFVGDMSFCC